MNKLEIMMAEKVEAVKARAKHLLKNPNDLFKPQRRVIARKVRKAVTGDEKKRIRDHLVEKKKEPGNTKLFDKISFTLGVLNIPVCQFFMLNRPDLFWAWFTFIIPTLLIARCFYYTKIKMQYFLYDFCYFTNILSVATMHTYHIIPFLFRIVFIFCNGPLGWAVVVWRNSLVYHDFDRMTSIYIHILPAMLSYCVRWHGLSPSSAGVLRTQDFVSASLVYLFWQFLYYYKTEVMDKSYLDENPEVVTSLRWLATDKKNGMARMVLHLCRRLGIFAHNEDYNPRELKTLLVFMGAQFIYTLITMVPTVVLYDSKPLQLAFIAIIFVCVVYNGASYYIEIFSKRYQLKFAKKEDMQKVVQAAAEIAYEATQTVSSPRRMPGLDSSKSLGGSSKSLKGSSKSLQLSKSSTNSIKSMENSTIAETVLSNQRDEDDQNSIPNIGLSLDTVDNPDGESDDGVECEKIVGGDDYESMILEEKRERTQSEDVRHIIEAATTVFVDEWHLANENHLDEEEDSQSYHTQSVSDEDEDDCTIRSNSSKEKEA